MVSPRSGNDTPLDAFIRSAEKILNEMIPRKPEEHFINYRDDVRGIVSDMEDKTLDEGFFTRFCRAFNEYYFEKKAGEEREKDGETGSIIDEEVQIGMAAVYAIAAVREALNKRMSGSLDR